MAQYITDMFTGFFNEEIIKRFFHARILSQMEGNTMGRWVTAPCGLQQRSLVYCVESCFGTISVFGGYAHLVFEKEFSRLGVDRNDGATRTPLMRRWCRMCMHDLWHLGWIAIRKHKSDDLKPHLSRFQQLFPFSTGRWGFPGGDPELRFAIRMAIDHHYVIFSKSRHGRC